MKTKSFAVIILTLLIALSATACSSSSTSSETISSSESAVSSAAPVSSELVESVPGTVYAQVDKTFDGIWDLYSELLPTDRTLFASNKSNPDAVLYKMLYNGTSSFYMTTNANGDVIGIEFAHKDDNVEKAKDFLLIQLQKYLARDLSTAETGEFNSAFSNGGTVELPEATLTITPNEGEYVLNIVNKS